MRLRLPSLLGAISYAYGWNRVGAVVMVLLDPADVPLHMAKQFKYVGDARGGAVQKAGMMLATSSTTAL